MWTEADVRRFLVELMRQEGLTQMGVSRELGIPQPTLNRFLNGRSVSVRHFLKIVDYVALLSPNA